MTVQEWYDTGDRIKVGKHEIFYQEDGDGPVLLLLHGQFNSSYEWKFIWKELSQHYRLVAPDLLGYGFSSKPAKYIPTPDSHTQIITELLRALQIEKVFVLGRHFSIGTTMELLLRQSEGRLPFTIQGCTFLNGILFDYSRGEASHEKLTMMLTPKLTEWLASYSAYKYFGLKYFVNLNQRKIDFNREAYGILIHGGGRANIWYLSQYIKEWRAKGLKWKRSFLKNTTPVQLLWGIASNNRPWGLEQLNDYRKIKGDKNVVMLKEIGHWPHIEAPELVISYITSFFDGLPKQP